MPDYQITIQLPTVKDVHDVINGSVFPLLAQAVQAIAQEAQRNWIDEVAHAKLRSGEKKAYIESIRIRYLTDLSAEVVSNYKSAYEIENGRPQRDLKAMLNTSTKVRRSEKGKRFLVIPLRYNTPGNTALAPAMPPSVYELASQMKPSAVTGQGERPAGEVTMRSPLLGMVAAPVQTPYLSHVASQKAYLVPQAQYQWGGRLTRAMLKDEAPTVRKRYAGMVRMTNATGGSTYLTFRTMQEGSTGWIVPAQPGLLIAKGVAEHLQPVATAAIEEAMRREGLSA